MHSYEEFVCLSLQNSRSLSCAPGLIKEVLISYQRYKVKEKLSLGLQAVIWRWLIEREIKHKCGYFSSLSTWINSCYFVCLMSMCIFCCEKEKTKDEIANPWFTVYILAILGVKETKLLSSPQSMLNILHIWGVFRRLQCLVNPHCYLEI